MILYYALGGGLGSVVRARAVFHTLEESLECSQVLISEELFRTEPFKNEMRFLCVPDGVVANKDELKDYLVNLLGDVQPRRFYTDTFYYGIHAELYQLSELSALECFHVARLLHTEAYQPPCFEDPLWRYKRVYLCEDLLPDQLADLRSLEAEMTPLDLFEPEPNEITEVKQVLSAKAPYWLIVHAGSIREIDELIAYAQMLRKLEASSPTSLVLCSPFYQFFLDEVDWGLCYFPAASLFSGAERIFSGAGFNSIRQTREFSSKHFVLPFERRFDRQDIRAARKRIEALHFHPKPPSSSTASTRKPSSNT